MDRSRTPSRASNASRNTKSDQSGQRRRSPLRRLRLEPLEHRRVLASFVVTTPTDVVDDGDALISLREAVVLANNNTGNDEITFDASVFAVPRTIALTLGQLEINQGVQIQGPGRHLLTIDGQSNSRVFDVRASGIDRDVGIADLTITGGRTAGLNEDGGAIRHLGGDALVLSRLAMTNNQTDAANSDGGAIASTGTLIVSGSILSGNRTTGASAVGGAIASSGPIMISDSELIGNFTLGSTSLGGAIYSLSNLTLTNSLVRQNSTAGVTADGGAIYAEGRLTVQSTRLVGNQTRGQDADGGAVSVFQAVTAFGGGFFVTDSDIHGNATLGDGSRGAGIYADFANGSIRRSSLTENQTEGSAAHGGAVAVTRTEFTIDQSTISGNRVTGSSSVGGGIGVITGSASLHGVTVTDNESAGGGGGIEFASDLSSSELELINSIVAGNQSDGSGDQAGPDLRLILDRPTLTVRSSLIGTNIGNSLAESQTPDADGNLIGGATPETVIDAGLLPLQIAGITRVHALVSSSPAIDGGDTTLSASVVTDQRGMLFDRVASSAIDIGAFESQSLDPSRFVVTTLVDELDFTNDEVSLREAIIASNQNEGDDVITFDPSVLSSNDTINLSSGQLQITGSVSIVGPVSEALTIDAGSESRIFESIGDANVTIDRLRLRNGRTVGPNVILANYSDARLTLNNGGAIRSESSGLLTLRGVTLADNGVSAPAAIGGGLWAEAGAVTIEDSIIINNRGGGVAVSNAIVRIDRSAVIGNLGSGISVQASNARIVNTTISDNTATDGGGIFQSGSSNVSLVQTTVFANSALRGGGIVVDPSDADVLSIANSIIGGNTSTTSNPDLSVPSASGDLAISFSLIADNSGTELTEASTPDVEGNLIGDPAGSGVIDPLLASIAVAGGSIPVHLPMAGSPVIDAGSDEFAVDFDGVPLTNDARGVPFARFVGTVDMGAAEVQTATPTNPVVSVGGPQITLVRDGDDLVVRRRNVEVFRARRDSINRLTINGDEFSNVLTIDQSGGNAIPDGGLTFDGIDRVNTIRWIGGPGNLDLTSTGNLELRNVAVIDLTDPDAQTVLIDSDSARLIDPDGGGILMTGVIPPIDTPIDQPRDAVSFADGSDWRMATPEVVSDTAFRTVTIVGTFVQTDFGSGFQNLSDPSDVNNNGTVTANDALVIINELGRRQFSSPNGGRLVDPADVDPWPGFYYDQNGDGFATPLDALRVINQLARTASGGDPELIDSEQIDTPKPISQVRLEETLFESTDLVAEHEIRKISDRSVPNESHKSSTMSIAEQESEIVDLANLDRSLSDQVFVESLS